MPLVTLSDGKSYTLYWDYDASKLREASVDVRIEWLKERLHLILIRFMDNVFKRDAPHYCAAHAEDMTFSLAGTSLMLNAIEALGELLPGDGETSDGRRAFFHRWLNRYMDDWATHADLLWRAGRNGMAHYLNFGRSGLEVGLEQPWVTKEDGRVVFDPERLYDAFRNGVRRYFQELQEDRSGDLREAFEQKYRRDLNHTRPE